MTIKETAGKILLYFYQLHRTAPLSMRDRQLVFLNKKDGGVTLNTDKKWLTNNLSAINPLPTDSYNALHFLIDKGFLQARERITPAASIYVSVQLTDAGIDAIEGIERGQDGKRDFTITFNIKVDSDTNVEKLITDNLSMLLS